MSLHCEPAVWLNVNASAGRTSIDAIPSIPKRYSIFAVFFRTCIVTEWIRGVVQIEVFVCGGVRLRMLTGKASVR